MEFLIAGASAVCAGFFTNPLEVIKTRMQLQGELKERGKHAVYYKNSAQAAYQIARYEGVLALQNGLVPALWVQLIMNGSRLGGFQYADNKNWIRDKNGDISFFRAAFAAGCSGVFGHYASNPFHLARTRKQSAAAKAIAVGYQHKTKPLLPMLINIFAEQGIQGLFRGGVAVIPRAFVASSSQLMSFSYTKQWLNEFEYFRNRKLVTSFCGSFIGGIAISVLTAPFDLILVRLYNQGLNADNKGILYNGYFDCVYKVYKAEGLRAFYKGIGPMYMRLGPHSVLTLMFWDLFKDLYDKFV